MLNALWLNAQALDGDGDLQRVLTLAGTAASGATSEAVLYRRIGLRGQGALAITGSADIVARKPMVAYPAQARVTQVLANLAAIRALRASSYVLASATIWPAWHIELAAKAEVTVDGRLYPFALISASVLCGVTLSGDVPRRIRMLGGQDNTWVTANTPKMMRTCLEYSAVTAGATGYAVPDWLSGGVQYRGLAANVRTSASTWARIDPHKYMQAIGRSAITAATYGVARMIKMRGSLSLATVMASIPGPTLLIPLRGKTVTTRMQAAGTVYRTAYLAGTQRSSVMASGDTVAARLLASHVHAFMDASVHGVKTYSGSRGRGHTGAVASGVASRAWKGYGIGVLDVHGTASPTLAIKVSARGLAKVSASANTKVLHAIKLSAMAHVDVTAAPAGYFTTRSLTGGSMVNVNEHARLFDTRRIQGSGDVRVSQVADVWANLFDREPDFRTDVVDPGDWTDRIPAEDWTLFIVDDTQSMKTFRKQPSEVLAYDLDFTQWFAQIPDDDIQTADCMVTRATIGSPDDLTVVNTLLVADPGNPSGPAHVVKVWLSGGNDGATYHLTLTIHTEDGRVKETDFKLKVKDQ